MRKAYVKPMVEIETYELSASIAGNCSLVINLGPEFGDKKLCDKYEDGFAGMMSIRPGYSTMSTGGTPFYEDVKNCGCDCYYSSGGNIYFTS